MAGVALVRSRSGVGVWLVRGWRGVVDGVGNLLRQQAGTPRVCSVNSIRLVSTRLVRGRRGVVDGVGSVIDSGLFHVVKEISDLSYSLLGDFDRSSVLREEAR